VPDSVEIDPIMYSGSNCEFIFVVPAIFLLQFGRKWLSATVFYNMCPLRGIGVQYGLAVDSPIAVMAGIFLLSVSSPRWF